MRPGRRGVYVGPAVTGGASPGVGNWNGHSGLLSHLEIWIVAFLGGRTLRLVSERSYISSEINAGQCTRPSSAPAKALSIEPIWIKVAIEIDWSPAAFEDEENNQDESKDSDGTPNDATSNSARIGT